MRHFHSYGPVDCRYHFCVARKELIVQGVEQLIGVPEEGGHYFTIWAPRQTGKTWLMRQIKQKISQQYPDRFTVFNFSLGGLRGMSFSPPGSERSLARRSSPLPIETDSKESNSLDFPQTFGEFFQKTMPGSPEVKSWNDFRELFSRDKGLWEHPLILLIDEVDTIPSALIDLMVAQFRELYLHRETNWLHGLALIGVRAVLGIESQRGSPFNIQKSLHVPNFTIDEVEELYCQYQEESGQKIEAAVVEKIYQTTKGQPGLVSWFGELLTEKYNPGQNQIIDMDTWDLVWHKARFVEPNNTVMNLIAKAKMPEYQGFLMELFTRSDMPFSFYEPLCNYLYIHGIVESETTRRPNGELGEICHFASPFIQDCLYHALSREVVGDRTPILALQPLDDLADVFSGTSLDLPVLLRRYKDYLLRLKDEGINTWKEQPRRETDLHLTEAVGHFHLFTWLQTALGRRCVISPEFPTGNGKVDIPVAKRRGEAAFHIRCGAKRGIIEVKSFVDIYEAKSARKQAAQYAKSLGFEQVTVAMFVPVDDETILEKLSAKEMIEGVQVKLVAIGWT